MSDPYRFVWEAALPYLRARKNDVHIPLAVGYAERLLSSYPDADRDVVVVGTLLHDIGWALVDQDELAAGETPGPEMNASEMRVAHEREGARLAGSLLRSLDYAPALIDEVVEIIAGHDSRLHALSLNDSLVKDSDKLWRFCTAGIGVACHWFHQTPAEYGEAMAAELDEVLFTEAAVVIARADIAVARRELRFDVLAAERVS